MTSTAEVVEEQEVARAEPARLAVGCLEFELASQSMQSGAAGGMEISEPVLGPAERDDSGGGERIGDCDWRSGRRERGKLEFHVPVLEVRLFVDSVVDANIAQRFALQEGSPSRADDTTRLAEADTLDWWALSGDIRERWPHARAVGGDANGSELPSAR